MLWDATEHNFEWRKCRPRKCVTLVVVLGALSKLYFQTFMDSITCAELPHDFGYFPWPHKTGKLSYRTCYEIPCNIIWIRKIQVVRIMEFCREYSVHYLHYMYKYLWIPFSSTSHFLLLFPPVVDLLSIKLAYLLIYLLNVY